MALTLNVADGFNVDYYWTGVAYDTYIGNTDKFTVKDEYSNLCYRFRASGGTPPYVYNMIGNAPSVIGLVNRPRSEYYHEYADLTLTAAVTFVNTDAGVKNVAITCTDSAGENISVYGTITINKSITYGLTLEPVDTTTRPSTSVHKDFTGYKFLNKKAYISTTMTGMTDPILSPAPGWYYMLENGCSVNIFFAIKGTQKNPKNKPKVKIYKKPTFLTFEQPDTDKLEWKLTGLVEANVKDKFYPLYFVMEDGPSSDKDIYPMINMMFYVPGIPSL